MHFPESILNFVLLFDSIVKLFLIVIFSFRTISLIFSKITRVNSLDISSNLTLIPGL